MVCRYGIAFVRIEAVLRVERLVVYDLYHLRCIYHVLDIQIAVEPTNVAVCHLEHLPCFRTEDRFVLKRHRFIIGGENLRIRQDPFLLFCHQPFAVVIVEYQSKFRWVVVHFNLHLWNVIQFKIFMF